MVEIFLQEGPGHALCFSQMDVTGHTALQQWSEKTGGDAQGVIAMTVQGTPRDLTTPLKAGDTLTWIFREDAQGLDILRHSAAHVLAQAVKELYPEAQITIGPVIEDGFYYDIFRETPFQPQDLVALEKRMADIVQRNLGVQRQTWPREKAQDFFRQQGELFKADIVAQLPEAEEISVYTQGDFTDLCRGPHIASTGVLGKGFRLLKVSGAYWRGDQKNPQLQRIYGTAWPSQEALEKYLYQKEEAEKRDHRKVGKDMDLFHFQQEAPGSVFWHGNGWTIYRLLQNYIREKLQHRYHEVNTPQVVSCSLWQKSGHWEVFRHNMMSITHNDLTYALKPMSCPCHIQIFNQGIKSYRDLPLRYAEFGRVTRDEPSGALAGLMRLRAFVQDDGHVFCAPEHLVEETKLFCQDLFAIYNELGFQDVLVRFSTRPDQRLGTDDQWDEAESALQKGADAAGLSCVHFPKEGAFYGPKLEFVLKDSLGRLWQCGTLQVDFMMPQRLEAHYVDRQGQSRPCVILHRAILGSMERFMGVLLEHTGGRLPFWLAPVQVVVVIIQENVLDYGQKVAQALQDAGIRVATDFRGEKLGYKIREHTLKKVPCLMILGAQEQEAGTVSCRWGGATASHVLPLGDAVKHLVAASTLRSTRHAPWEEPLPS